MDAINIRAWLVQRLADLRGAAPHDIDIRSSFHRQGVDSLAATRLVADLSAFVGRSLPRTIVWQYTTIESLVRYLVDGESASSAPKSDLASTSAPDEPIAIIGMACRFPGAPNLDAFWKLLCEGRDAITEVPKQRWDTDAFYDENADAPGRMRTKWGGFIDGVDKFEPQFFGISPRETIQMDPQQRIMLELAWEALEHAGIAPASLVDRSAGVFIGAMWQDYAKLAADSPGAINQHTATGQDLSIVAARISYTFGLRGPSIAVNTACSSSLVAIHYARRSLQLGECDIAIVGGVNLILSPMSTVAMSKFGAMAPDGRSKAFDARANGYVRGEGAGIVIMKRLSQALADGDPIHCIIRGSAINNDGASNGLTAPSPRAQALVLEQAYRDAGIEPHEVQFVETHGTGTLLGDPIEAGALGAVLGANRPADRPLILGAVKTNIGHLEAAAGIAGLIKAALALEHGVIPANLHFREPNPHIAFDTLHLRVPTQCEPWPQTSGRALAGVSSFGFGGTNCHVVLEAPRPAARLPGNARTTHSDKENPQSIHGPVFVFGGQGSQWLRMGMELLHEPAFHASMVRCGDAIREHLDGDLLKVLIGRDPGWLEDTAWIQPAIFAVQVSLAALFRARGIEPAAVIGQSMGEVAAAHVAGCLRLSDAVRIICARSRIVRQAAGKGGMAVVESSIPETRYALEPYADRLSIAVSTSPYSTVIAGDFADVEAFVAAATSRGVDARPIKVDYASHCAQMDPLLPDLAAALEGVEPRRGTIPFYSSVFAGKVDGITLDAGYWCQNLRQPVLLAETICQLVRLGHRVFLELDPHPLLVRAVEECLRHEEKTGVVICPMHRDEPRQFVEVSSALDSFTAPRALPLAAPVLFPLSAHDERAVRERAQACSDWLSKQENVELHDFAYTAGVRRTHHEYRLGVMGTNKQEIADALREFASGEMPERVIFGKAPDSVPRVVFVFPGQGSQWVGMGRRLLQDEIVFRDALEACDAAIRQETGWSVIEELHRSEKTSRLAEIDVVQPVLVAIEIALAALWRSWGIEPSAVVGHSMGEVAAAHVAGALSLEDAAAVICRRSRLLRRVSGRGAMALVELTLPNAARALVGYEDRLSVAVSNGPRSTVIAGDSAALAEVLEKLERNGVFCRRVKVDVASHSPQMDPLRDELLAALEGITSLAPRIPMRSTVTLESVGGCELSAKYWADNLREPVLFSDVVKQCIADGQTFFLEMSPHPILVPAVEENLQLSNATGAALASLRRGQDERQTVLSSLGSLYVNGFPVIWKRLFPNGGRVVELPAYPWQKQRHWHENPQSPIPMTPSMASYRAATSKHPLLGWSFEPSAHSDARYWQQTITAATIPYLADHRVHDEIIFPGTAFVEVALAAASATFGPGPHLIEDLSFEQMMSLDDHGARDVQIALLTSELPSSFQISSREKDGDPWLQHARGVLRSSEHSTGKNIGAPTNIAARLNQSVDVDDHYRNIRERGIHHGPSFQGITDIRVGEREVLGKVRLPEGVQGGNYVVHPALLDACFQLFFAFLDDDGGTYVPVRIERLFVHRNPAPEVWVWCVKRPGQEASGQDIRCDLHVIDDGGNVLITIEGLSARRIDRRTAEDPLANCVYEVAWTSVQPLSEPQFAADDAWLVLADGGGLAHGLAERLSNIGQRCIAVHAALSYQRIGTDQFGIDLTNPEEYRRLLRDVFGDQGSCRGVVHLSSLDGGRSFPQKFEYACVTTTYLTQAIVKHGFRTVPRLFLVTRGAQSLFSNEAISVFQAPLLGLGKTIAMEHPELACKRIDLQSFADEHDVDRLLCELGTKDREDQIAWRGNERYVARLVRGRFDHDDGQTRPVLLEPADSRSFRLEIHNPGVLERLALHELSAPVVGPDDVLVEVEAAGLNFLDVLTALGALPGEIVGGLGNGRGPRLGGECAGIVVAVGKNVSEFAPGDEVIALATCTFASHVIASRRMCVHKPVNMNWAEAATLPIVAITAYYALEYAAKLRAGERVLIHAGAGGVGLAAIQWAKHVGAEIFATAGSEEKRSYLRSLGVHHVLDSRSLQFADEVKRITRGDGIDVVLNSLSGDFIAASLGLLRDYGRFVEIGKRDYLANKQLGLRPFLRNLSFSLVDIRAMMQQRPDLYGRLLQEVIDLVASGALQPSPTRTFPVSQAAEAFQHMAQTKHIGKIAIAMKDADARIVPLAREWAVDVRPDRTYLITGGLGGLGLVHAQWFVEQGARNLVLVGRKGPNEHALAAIELMERVGARVHCLQVDVANEKEVERMFALVRHEMPPLGGIAHAAAVLEDHTLLEQSEESFRRVFAPKAVGGWNLHLHSLDTPIDFFLMYSSAAALLGSPGQANYCAANAFLDALAHERVRLGLPAMSIQWGPFAEVGLAAATDIRGKRLSYRGMDSFSPAEGLEALRRLLARPRPEVGIVRLDARKWVEFFPAGTAPPFFSTLTQGDSINDHVVPEAETFLTLLADARAEERHAILVEFLAQHVAHVLRLSPEHIQTRRSLPTLGLDSLMLLELRNRIEPTLGITLSTTVFLQDGGLQQIATYLLEKVLHQSLVTALVRASMNSNPVEDEVSFTI